MFELLWLWQIHLNEHNCVMCAPPREQHAYTWLLQIYVHGGHRFFILCACVFVQPYHTMHIFFSHFLFTNPREWTSALLGQLVVGDTLRYSRWYALRYFKREVDSFITRGHNERNPNERNHNEWSILSLCPWHMETTMQVSYFSTVLEYFFFQVSSIEQPPIRQPLITGLSTSGWHLIFW